MSNVESLKDEVTRNVGPRKLIVPTPYTPYNGVLRPGYLHRNAKHECYVFMRLDGKGAHFARATQWSQTRILTSPNPELWFFQVMLLLAESGWFGSQRPLADRRYDPRGYRLAVQLQARAKLDMATTAELGLLKTLLKSDEYFDAQFDYDVRSEMLAAQIRDEEEKKANGGGEEEPPAEGAPQKRKRGQKKKRGALSSASAAAPAGVAAPQSISADCPLPPLLFDEDEWVAVGDFAAIDASITFLLREQGKRHNANIVQATHALYVDDSPDLQARIREAVTTQLVAPAPDADRLVPKVEFTVTYVDSPTGGGLMCRFFIADPNMDPGLFLAKCVLPDIEKREMAKLQGANTDRQHAHREQFPHYRPLYERSHHPLSKRTNRQTYFNMMTALCPEYLQRYPMREEAFRNMAFEHAQDRAHPYQVLTLERALRTMIDVGCDPAHCDGALWRNEMGPVAPDDVFNPLRTMMYMPQAVFWRNFHYLGLSEQFMPHVDADSDFLSALIEGEDLRRFLPGGENLPAPPRSAANRMYVDNWLISREAVNGQTLLNYQTNNEFMHLAARAAIVNKRVAQDFPPSIVATHALIEDAGSQWRKRIDLVDRVADFERYRVLINKAQDSCFLAFCPLWPLEGDVDDVPAAKQIRALLRWYRDNRGSKLPNMSREFHIWDDELGLFGNSMLKSLKLFACIGRVVHPSICLLSEGLLSCYRYAPRELFFNIMAHGRYDVGKTFILINTLMRLITISDTVEEYTSESRAASTTQNHTYDTIIASDEVMPWKVDSAEAKKNPDLVNQEKVKMVTQKVGKKVFAFVKTDDGEKHRWTRHVTTDHYASLVEVTNFNIEEKNALSSRYHTITVPLSRIPVRELIGRMGASLTEDTRLYFHINQYLSALAYKAIMCGVMLEPNMDLFHDVSNRVMNYLVRAKVLSQETGARGLEVMKPYAVQMVVHQAHHSAFDMPSSPNWKKPFEVKHIREEQRYLYCTVEIVWWCWTAMACEWIVVTNAHMIEAAVASLCVDWEPTRSAYYMYERDINDQIPWRLRPNGQQLRSNRAGGGGNNDGNDVLVDLNYITFEGSVDKVAGNIAAASNGRISKVEVVGAIYDLAGRRIELTGGGIIPQPAAQFKRYHKYRVLPSEDDMVDGTKETALSDGSMGIPNAYMISNQDQSVQRTEKDVPRYPASHQFSPVEISDDGKYVYIMPTVASYFKTRVIIDALIYATTCKTMRPGKILLGLPADHDSMQLQVHNCSRQWIAYTVNGLDEAEGIGADGRWYPKEGEQPKKSPDEEPTSRREGIAFTRRGGISEMDAQFITTVPLAPVSEQTRAQRQQRSRSDLAGMQEMKEVIRDLDHHSARVQHLRCGLSLDEPVHDPAWIEAEFRKAAGAEASSHINYPADWEQDVELRNRVWDSMNDTSKQEAWLRKQHAQAQVQMRAPAPRPAPRPAAAAPSPAPPSISVVSGARVAEQISAAATRDNRQALGAVNRALQRVNGGL
jgi:hypothetical protein